MKASRQLVNAVLNSVLRQVTVAISRQVSGRAFEPVSSIVHPWIARHLSNQIYAQLRSSVSKEAQHAG